MKRERQHHQAAFELYYSSDRSLPTVSQSCGVSVSAVEKWKAAFNWYERANARDAEAARQAEKAAVGRRIKVLDEQRQAGELMRRRGVEYFTTNKVAKAQDAINAITKGVDLERSAEGLPTGQVTVEINDSRAELAARLAARAARRGESGADSGAAGGDSD